MLMYRIRKEYPTPDEFCESEIEVASTGSWVHLYLLGFVDSS
jgi:hypothetical protein